MNVVCKNHQKLFLYEKNFCEIEKAEELGKQVGQILKTKSNNTYKKWYAYSIN